jgi:hypothetical protein
MIFDKSFGRRTTKILMLSPLSAAANKPDPAADQCAGKNEPPE